MPLSRQRNNPGSRRRRKAGAPQLTRLENTRAEGADCPGGQTAAHKLWLCVYFPRLAIDVLARDAHRPLLAIETRKGQQIVYAGNEVAAQQGIRAGMTLAAALPLARGLRSLVRDPRAETDKLNRIAMRAYDLSSQVSLYQHDAIVLEIKASLRLFAGIDGLLQRLQQELTAFDIGYTLAVAPTSTAAYWLARHCPGRRVLVAGQLLQVLRAFPIQVVAEDHKQTQQLHASGIRTLADLWRLPRAALARRFGKTILQVLDQALGRTPEPLSWFSPPPAFKASEELFLPAADGQRLQPLFTRLFERLQHFLRQHQAATRQLWCLLLHAEHPPTRIRLDTVRYERRAEYFMDLFRGRLERLQLPADVVAVSLHCRQIHMLPAENLDLLHGRGDTEHHWARLIDRLRARLGRGRISGLNGCADHRPEFAAGLATSQHSEPGRAASGIAMRPLWLLSRPLPIKQQAGDLHWRGPLRIASLPERIEQGWWDNEDIRRDYYRASNTTGEQVWVFHNLRDRRWYLHGVFA